MVYAEHNYRKREEVAALPDFSYLAYAKSPFIAPHPQLAQKIGVSAPYIYLRTQDHIKRSLATWALAKIELVRFLIPDTFDDGTLEQIAQAGELIDHESGGTVGWSIDILDGYHIWHSAYPNGAYPRSALRSRFLKRGGIYSYQSQNEFFKDGSPQDADYTVQLEHLVRNFAGVRGWRALSLINEPGRKWPLPESRVGVTDWVGRHAVKAHELLNKYGLDIAVTVEMERPNLLDQRRLRDKFSLSPQELTIGLHLYSILGRGGWWSLSQAQNVIQNSLFPLSVGELGNFPRFFGLKGNAEDGILKQLSDVVHGVVIDNHLAASTFILWHGDSTHPDGLYIDVGADRVQKALCGLHEGLKSLDTGSRNGKTNVVGTE